MKLVFDVVAYFSCFTFLIVRFFQLLKIFGSGEKGGSAHDRSNFG